MRTRIFAAAAMALACSPVVVHAGFDIDPAMAKTLAPKPAEPAPPAATLVAAHEPKADPIAKIAAASDSPAAPSANQAAALAVTSAPVAAAAVGTTVAAARVAVAAPQPTAIREWQIEAKDLTIYATLRRWAKEANWQVSWEVPVDYPATLTSSFRGSFEDVTEQVLMAYKNSEFPLQGCFYQANQVLRVTRYVANSRDCQ